MRQIVTLAMLSTTVLLSACNEPFRQDMADVQASQRAVQKDQESIMKYQSELERDRAEKAAAKARGDVPAQARESIEIGWDKMLLGGKKAEEDVDQQILAEDEKDLRQ